MTRDEKMLATTSKKTGLLIFKFILFLSLNAFSFVYAKNCEMWYEDSNQRQVGYLPKDAIMKFYDTTTWKRSLKEMDVFMVRLNALYFKKNQLNDYFIKNKLYKVLKTHNVKLALDVRGATLTSSSPKKHKEYKRELKMIGRLSKMGVKIDYVFFQSALCESQSPKKSFDVKAHLMDKAIGEIVMYAKEVHSKYPHIKFGLIDALPIKGLPYKEPYSELKKRLKANGIILDSILLDGPYSRIENHFRGLSWQKIVAVENFVKNELGIKFGKIYTDNRGGMKSDRAFYENLIKMAKRYKNAGGDPDYCVLMSWFHYPKYTIPETQPYTMTYDFLKLSNEMK